MEKARFLLAAIIIAAGGYGLESHVHKLSEYPVKGGCRTTIFQTSLMPGGSGITLPANLSGDTMIFVENPLGRAGGLEPERSGDIVYHERGHAEQYCERGNLIFLLDYITEKDFLEKDASFRGMRLRDKR